MRLCQLTVIAALAAGCYADPKDEDKEEMRDDIETQIGDSDIDHNGIIDYEQAVVVADGLEGTNMCTVVHKPVQAVVSCDELEVRGYGCGAYEDWLDEDTNWESGCVELVDVTDGDGNAWCGVQLRPNQEYRLTTAAPWAELYERDGWSDHALTATADAGDFRWVDIRSEGSGDCFFEAANIVLGCDSMGHVYQTDGANLGERDPNCVN